MTRYVQHKSGVGKKWEVLDDYDDSWRVDKQGTVSKAACHWLPKSEYVEVPAPPTVPAPDRWVDVTEQCTADSASLYHAVGPTRPLIAVSTAQWNHEGVYRLRKVKSCYMSHTVHVNDPTYHWAFIVERKEPA